MMVRAFYVLNLYDRAIAYSLHETRVEQTKQVFLEKNLKFHHKLSIIVRLIFDSLCHAHVSAQFRFITCNVA